MNKFQIILFSPDNMELAQFYKAAFDGLTVPAIILQQRSTGNFFVQEANHAAINQLEISRSMLGKDLADTLPNAPPTLPDKCRQVLNSGKAEKEAYCFEAGATSRHFSIGLASISASALVLTFIIKPDQARNDKKRSLMLETILEGTMAGYWDWLINEDYEYLSPTFKSMFGYAEHEMANHPESWQKIIHPDDLAGVYEAYNDHVNSHGEIPYENEVRYFHKDGSIVWVYCRGKVIEWDKEGNPVRMVGSHVDVTPLKQVHEELLMHQQQLEKLVRERTGELESANEQLNKEAAIRAIAEQRIKLSEARYYDLFENAPDMYASVDTQTSTIRECNQTLAKEIGLNKSDIIGKSIIDLYSEDCLDDVKTVFNAFKETGDVSNAELKLKRQDGSVIDVMLNVSAIRDENGNIIANRSSWRDVTQLKAARQAAQDNVARIRAIVDTAVDAIITIDKAGKVESFNPAAEHTFGYKAEEIVGQNINILMPPQREKHDQFLNQFTKEGKKYEIRAGYEIEGRHKDGGTFPVEFSLSELEVKGEQLFTGIIRDITERKQLELIKDEFVSIVSHELRTPLTSINGSLGAIVSGTVGELPEMALKMVTIARRNCERLVRLINDLLDIQKMEAGKYEIESEKVELISLIEQSIESNTGYAREHSVKLQFTAEEDEIWVQGDADRLLQVLANLLSNAAKFSPAEGTVSIRAEKQESSIKISVIDRGEGIPVESQSAIFQKFTQADSSVHRSKGGTGLGLSISKRIVELHDGTIGLESEPGKGTTFYFELPVSTEKAEHEDLILLER